MPRPLSWFAGTLAAAYGAGLLGLSALHAVAPQRDGPLALTHVFAPHLFLPLALLVPLSLLVNGGRNVRGLRILLALALAAGVVRFGGGMVSLPPAPAAGDELAMPLLSWNLAAGQVAAAQLIDRLRQTEAQVVGLQELRPVHANAIDADPLLAERFPYRVLQPHPDVQGMALLSVHPILDSRPSLAPPYIQATVALPGERELTVVTAHPLPPRMGLLGILPRRYETGQRDEDLRTIRALVEPALADGRAVVLLGDLNVTDREPGYAELTRGLTDAHLAIGWGPGSTWRPLEFRPLPFGILRIDYLLTGGAARPLALSTDCPGSPADHCALMGSVAVRGDGHPSE